MDRRLRLDLTDSLIHWLKPTTSDVEREFVDALLHGRAKGSKPPYVLGDLPVVAFTEIPLALSAKLLLGARDFGINYAPVGFLFDRRWLFEHGARPAIYQSEAEARQLPDGQRYRHVTLDFERGIDFTWKREWRMAAASLDLMPGRCRPVLPKAADLARARQAVGDSARGLALLDAAVIVEHFL